MDIEEYISIFMMSCSTNSEDFNYYIIIIRYNDCDQTFVENSIRNFLLDTVICRLLKVFVLSIMLLGIFMKLVVEAIKEC